MDAETLQELKLAFVIGFAAKIVAADGEESFEEFSLLGQVFPRPLLRQASFIDDDGNLTDRWRARRDESLTVLPTLDSTARDEVFQLLYAASAVDQVAESELAVLYEAGEALGYDEATITARIGALSAG